MMFGLFCCYYWSVIAFSGRSSNIALFLLRYARMSGWIVVDKKNPSDHPEDADCARNVESERPTIVYLGKITEPSGKR